MKKNKNTEPGKREDGEKRILKSILSKEVNGKDQILIKSELKIIVILIILKIQNT